MENTFYSDSDKQRKADSEKARQRLSVRDGFERDFGRIIHSSTFRRLQSKTQVIGIGEGDFHRTRLTHSLEVSQIARGIATTLNVQAPELQNNNKLDTSLIETAALAHDLGHPPFGHKGERSLHKHMQAFGLGFEGNAHTFRLLTNLEGSEGTGLDLTRATLLSILKYPAVISSLVHPSIKDEPPKSSFFDEDLAAFEWLIADFTEAEKAFFMQVSKPNTNKHIKTMTKTLECTIIELADDIAYGTHDLQDALKLKLIDLELLVTTLQNRKANCSDRIIEAIDAFILPADPKSRINELFADLISAFITDIRITKRNDFLSNRLKYCAELSEGNHSLLEDLKNLVVEHVIFSQRVQTSEWRGGIIIDRLFEAMIEDKRLLPELDRAAWIKGSDKVNARIVCDYIAGMTDTYALKIYSRLFESTGGRLFDI
ncbi:anti-phage deoxyguanosine triphosphatase [Paenibacillus psychroresistens]|uniref:anti-phage deoxyguanosine triphosphatase n=1 Tax=Paenibacillus psychroresistens TaxID=1778678 RepID=UPI001D04F6E1|nr:anti-phage deoxyguanosine triphosphatase [Paenibacillus psychroresistens]